MLALVDVVPTLAHIPHTLADVLNALTIQQPQQESRLWVVLRARF